jgi:hypothetical protein
MFKSLCNILTPPTTQKNIMCRWGSVYITIKHLSYTFYVQPFSDPFKLQDFRKKKTITLHMRDAECISLGGENLLTR